MRGKIILISILLILAFGMQLAFAADSSDAGNFTQLNDEISHSSDSFSLDRDYSKMANESAVVISKSFEIRGNNHTLESEDSDVFEINTSNIRLVLNDIRFKNATRFDLKNDAGNVSVTFINCSIVSAANHTELYEEMDLRDLTPGTGGPVSELVKNKALEIVGDKTGVTAARILAKWVKANIQHETLPGFYQSPDTTLLRKLGNCCCKSNLFLQMCEAAGVMQYCTLSFVHVGKMKFGERHFFCLVDNLCVDVDTVYPNPWGLAGFFNRPVYSVTQYPNFPISRNY